MLQSYRNMRTMYLVLLMFISSSLLACNSNETGIIEDQGSGNRRDTLNSDSMKLKIIVGEKVVMATLSDNPTTRDFISLLPLSTTLEDYAGTEKISYLSKKLSVDNVHKRTGQTSGDIAYYVPWGNLAIFYKGNAGNADGLVIFGKIDSGKEALNVPGAVHVKIELAGNQ